MNKHVKQPSVVGPLRVAAKTGPQRPALGEVTATAVNKQVCLRIFLVGRQWCRNGQHR